MQGTMELTWCVVTRWSLAVIYRLQVGQQTTLKAQLSMQSISIDILYVNVHPMPWQTTPYLALNIINETLSSIRNFGMRRTPHLSKPREWSQLQTSCGLFLKCHGILHVQTSYIPCFCELLNTLWNRFRHLLLNTTDLWYSRTFGDRYYLTRKSLFHGSHIGICHRLLERRCVQFWKLFWRSLQPLCDGIIIFHIRVGDKRWNLQKQLRVCNI